MNPIKLLVAHSVENDVWWKLQADLEVEINHQFGVSALEATTWGTVLSEFYTIQRCVDLDCRKFPY